MWLGWKRMIPAALLWIMVTAVVNTEGISRNIRLGVFGLLFLIALFWMGRGDPRLALIQTPKRSAREVPSGVS